MELPPQQQTPPPCPRHRPRAPRATQRRNAPRTPPGQTGTCPEGCPAESPSRSPGPSTPAYPYGWRGSHPRGRVARTPLGAPACPLHEPGVSASQPTSPRVPGLVGEDRPRLGAFALTSSKCGEDHQGPTVRQLRPGSPPRALGHRVALRGQGPRLSASCASRWHLSAAGDGQGPHGTAGAGRAPQRPRLRPRWLPSAARREAVSRLRVAVVTLA